MSECFHVTRRFIVLRKGWGELDPELAERMSERLDEIDAAGHDCPGFDALKAEMMATPTKEN